MFVIFLDLTFSLKNDTITTSWGETLVPESTFEHKIGDAAFASVSWSWIKSPLCFLTGVAADSANKLSAEQQAVFAKPGSER